MKAYSRAIVIKDDELLVMERHKGGHHYFTLLGGKIENNETPEQAVVREVKEESNIDIKNPRLVFIEDAEAPFGQQQVFLCEYVAGEPSLPDDSEEAYWTVPDKNTYTPQWVKIADLPKIPFVSTLLREAILMAVEHGFPKDVYRFTSKHSYRLS